MMFGWIEGITMLWTLAVVGGGALTVALAGYCAWVMYEYWPFMAEKPPPRISEGGWRPTGRIDFAMASTPETSGLHEAQLLLRAEDTRLVESVTGVALKEQRWRLATLDEAKKIVRAFHLTNDQTGTPPVQNG